MIAIAMTTCPRPKPTKDKALKSLRAAGFDQDVMIVDDPDKRGALPTWGRALEQIRQTDAPFLMIVQDDTTWSDGSRLALERELTALGETATNAGMLSPFLVNKIGRELMNRGIRKDGWHPSLLGYASGGALCYILPRKSADVLTADDGYQEFLRTRDKNIDRLIPGRLNELGFACLFRMPSLVNHRLGSGNSSIKSKKPHDTVFWRAVA